MQKYNNNKPFTDLWLLYMHFFGLPTQKSSVPYDPCIGVAISHLQWVNNHSA